LHPRRQSDPSGSSPDRQVHRLPAVRGHRRFSRPGSAVGM